LDAAAFGSGGGEPKAAAKPHTLCISKKAAPRRPPSEASAYRSRAVKREIRQRAPRAVPIDRINYKSGVLKNSSYATICTPLTFSLMKRSAEAAIMCCSFFDAETMCF